MQFTIRPLKGRGFKISRGSAHVEFPSAEAAQARVRELVREYRKRGAVARFKSFDSAGKLVASFHYGPNGELISESGISAPRKRKSPSKAKTRKSASRAKTTKAKTTKRKSSKAKAPSKSKSAATAARNAGRKRYFSFLKKAKADGMSDKQAKAAWRAKKSGKAPSKAKAAPSKRKSAKAPSKAKAAPSKRKSSKAKAPSKKAPSKKAPAKRKTGKVNSGLKAYQAFIKAQKAAGKTHVQAVAAWAAKSKSKSKPGAKAKSGAKKAKTTKRKSSKKKSAKGTIPLLPTKAQAAAAARKRK